MSQITLDWNNLSKKGISLINSNPTCLIVSVTGPPTTLWSFPLTLQIKGTNCYHFNFLTIPFHPNISLADGRITPLGNDLNEMLVCIQKWLCDPDLDRSLNMEAKNIFLKSPRLYTQLVCDSRVMVTSMMARKNSVQSSKIIGKISFDDYYDRWKRVGTLPGNLMPKRSYTTTKKDVTNKEQIPRTNVKSNTSKDAQRQTHRPKHKVGKEINADDDIVAWALTL